MRNMLGTGTGLLFLPLLILLGRPENGGSATTLLRDSRHPVTEEVCATGCSAASDPTGDLAVDDFERLLATFATQPLDGTSDALDTLLFHRASTLSLLDEWACQLDPEREALLRAELERTHAILDVRIVDELGIERLHLGETNVPLGEKQHFHPHETTNLQPPEVSGTMYRVGLAHLWVRL